MPERLAKNGGKPAVTEKTPHYVWPLITNEMEQAVIAQLHDEISIYDKSGIFAKFENAFSSYHGMSHALLVNSGTMALFSIFEALQLNSDDEIICPAYTFFATASPLVYTRAKLVFADCGSDGNVDPVELKAKINRNTKAVVITHMWGIPCDMRAIVDICKTNNVVLIEDCSHAHGARFNGKLCGTFGDASAWSLQGQKIISGGEGGIILTNTQELFVRALLTGHYNKRCKQEIPKEHYLSKFSLTGFGLKLRAHPLAIAIALQQFSYLDSWIYQKQKYAEELTQALDKYDFVQTPNTENRSPSWYAYVFRIDERKTFGIKVEDIYKALRAEGMAEVDMPSSTCPIFDLPLFNEANKASSRFNKQNSISSDCSNSVFFYRSAIKLPMWALKENRSIFEQYKKGLTKVFDAILQQKFNEA